MRSLTFGGKSRCDFRRRHAFPTGGAKREENFRWTFLAGLRVKENFRWKFLAKGQVAGWARTLPKPSSRFGW
jgi:hypothetical protein